MRWGERIRTRPPRSLAGSLAAPVGALPARRVTDPTEQLFDRQLEQFDWSWDVAQAIVDRGKEAWDRDPVNRFAAEAVVTRLGELAGKLPQEVREATPEIPWHAIKGMRNLVTHEPHRIDYDLLWKTQQRDIPAVATALHRWRAREFGRGRFGGPVAEREVPSAGLSR